jgi:hypothetical protein
MPIRTGRRFSPRRTFLFGTQGVGKSTLAAQDKRAIFLPIEDGVDDIDCHSFDPAQSYVEFLANLEWLHVKEHSYGTIVIDTADWLERLIHADVCRIKQVQNIEDIGYAKGYVFALNQWRETLAGLSVLRQDRGLAITFVAHSRTERFESPDTDSYDRYVPKLHRLATDLLLQWCDEVFFASYKVNTIKTDEGFNRKKTKGIGTGERVLHCVERPAFVAKNRLGMPAEIPFDWHEYAKYLPAAEAAA